MHLLKGGPMSLFKKPGVSLLVVGLVLFFVVNPIAGALPLVGGILSTIAWIVGVLGIIGGGYLLMRSTIGPGAAS